MIWQIIEYVFVLKDCKEYCDVNVNNVNRMNGNDNDDEDDDIMINNDIDDDEDYDLFIGRNRIRNKIPNQVKQRPNKKSKYNKR